MMRRVIAMMGVCALLWGCMILGAPAQQVSIAGDTLLDISLRDADLSTVLTALFNTTGGKYQVRLGSGVTGRIARLQLSQAPFEKALDAILGTEYSYTRQLLSDGSYLYTISGRKGGSSVYTPRMPVLQAPEDGSLFGGSGSTFGSATGSPFGGTGTGGAATGGGSSLFSSFGSTSFGSTDTSESKTSSSESSVVKLVRINYLDVGMLSEYLGGTSIDLFSLMQSAGGQYGGGGGGSRRGGGSYRPAGGNYGGTNYGGTNYGGTNYGNNYGTNYGNNTTNRNNTNRNTNYR